MWDYEPGNRVFEETVQGVSMSKRGRKRRGRKKNKANHGRRPNA